MRAELTTPHSALINACSELKGLVPGSLHSAVCREMLHSLHLVLATLHSVMWPHHSIRWPAAPVGCLLESLVLDTLQHTLWPGMALHVWPSS